MWVGIEGKPYSLLSSPLTTKALDDFVRASVVAILSPGPPIRFWS